MGLVVRVLIRFLYGYTAERLYSSITRGPTRVLLGLRVSGEAPKQQKLPIMRESMRQEQDQKKHKDFGCCVSRSLAFWMQLWQTASLSCARALGSKFSRPRVSGLRAKLKFSGLNVSASPGCRCLATATGIILT